MANTGLPFDSNLYPLFITAVFGKHFDILTKSSGFPQNIETYFDDLWRKSSCKLKCLILIAESVSLTSVPRSNGRFHFFPILGINLSIILPRCLVLLSDCFLKYSHSKFLIAFLLSPYVLIIQPCERSWFYCPVSVLMRIVSYSWFVA